MDSNTPNQPPILQDRFPKMRPIKGTPSLFTLNGFGVGVYGKRDYDSETGTYIKTHCICFLFVPIFALGAYRVADAEKGWYFLGKERLSNFSRNWNRGVAVLSFALAIMLGWSVYTSSPEYKARQQLSEASEMLQAGDFIKSASVYRRVAGGTELIEEARQGLQKSIEKALQSDSPKSVEAAFRILKSVPEKLSRPTPLIANAFERGLTLVEKFKGKDPESALRIFEEVAAFDPKNPALPTLQTDLLKLSIAANPSDTNRVVQLALIYEKERQLEECRKLLLLHKEKLGSTEGARILGQFYLSDGQYEDAYNLLFPYVQTRLQQLRVVEKNYTTALNGASERALDFLRKGHGDPTFYQKHKTASKTEQETMVDEFIAKHLQADPSYKKALAALRSANQIVTVTLDLGIIQLNRAQSLKDPAARKTELEAAEKTFLAIRGFAGETDEYRLFLGQVYYWLGKSSEGKILFDQLLASSNRSYRTLMSLANTLRDVGETSEARDLGEEAYKVAKNNIEKYQAAAFRSLVYKDIEDEIAWLEKADPAQVWIQISLDGARGNKALSDGNKTAAATFLRKTVEGYAKLQKTAAVLNNGGLASLRLYEATGDIRDHDRGVASLEEAISMAPGDSILLINTANTLFTHALMDVVGPSIDFKILGEPANLTMLRHLYLDEAGKAEIFKRLHENATLRKSLIYLDKALLVSPKTASLYELQLELQKGFRELPEVQKLHQRLQTASLDFADIKNEWKAVLAGSKDKEYRERLETQIRKYETILKSNGIEKHPLTAEYCAVALNNCRQNAFYYGIAVDAAKILAEALSIHQKHQTSATTDALENAYLFAAHAELVKNSAEYASIAEQSRRVLAPQTLIMLLLEKDGPVAKLIRKNENVLKALQVKEETRSKFPSSLHISDWAMLKTFEPKAAAQIASALEANVITRALAELEWDLEPISPNTTLSRCWMFKMRGEPAKATEVYQRAVQDGFPLPAL